MLTIHLPSYNFYPDRKNRYTWVTGAVTVAALYYLYYINGEFNNDKSINNSQAIASPKVFYKHKPVISDVITEFVAQKTSVGLEKTTHPFVPPTDNPAKFSKIFEQFGAAEESVSDSDINYLINHYHVRGSEFLDRSSKLAFLRCNPDYTRYGHQGGFEKFLDVTPTSHGNCRKFSDMRFMNSTKVIMLVSFPGSGNTWTRIVLEQATGIFTGSIFCDRGLRSSGFYGEQIISSNVLAIKTHYPRDGDPSIGHFHPKHVDGVIFIMRNPFDSIVSERKRQVTVAQSRGGQQHIMNVDKKHFGMFTSVLI